MYADVQVTVAAVVDVQVTVAAVVDVQVIGAAAVEPCMHTLWQIQEDLAT